MPIQILMNAVAHAPSLPNTGPQLDNRRVLAGLIDLAVLGVGGLVIGMAAGALSGGGLRLTPALDLVLLGWALYYYFACESGGGQTFGKRLMRLRVVRADGADAGMGAIFVRTVLRVVDGIGLYLVGLIVMLATGKRRRRLGDLAGGTMVVDAASPAAPRPVGPEVPVGVPVPVPDPEPAPVPEPEPDPEPAPPAAVELASPGLLELGSDVDEQVPMEPEPPVVRSVETISAIDLVMGGAEDAEPQPHR